MSIWSFIKTHHPLLAREIVSAIEQGIDTIDMARTGQNSRRYVWSCIQSHNPALAQLLSDAGFLEVKAHFGASVQLECRVICQAIAKARRVPRASEAA
jgi:hypothetical protein